MQRTVVNPWSWQDRLGFVQGVDLRGVERLLVCAGQVSYSPDGEPLHPGDMKAQIAQALDNLEAVLAGAGMTLADVVRLNWFVTDVARFREVAPVHGRRLAEAGCRAASTLLQISALARPELMVEVEALAAA